MTVWEWRSGVTKRLYLLARLLSSFATRPKGVNPYEFTPRREHTHVGLLPRKAPSHVAAEPPLARGSREVQ